MSISTPCARKCTHQWSLTGEIFSIQTRCGNSVSNTRQSDARRRSRRSDRPKGLKVAQASNLHRRASKLEGCATMKSSGRALALDALDRWRSGPEFADKIV